MVYQLVVCPACQPVYREAGFVLRVKSQSTTKLRRCALCGRKRRCQDVEAWKAVKP